MSTIFRYLYLREATQCSTTYHHQHMRIRRQFTHLLLNNAVAILADNVFKRIILNENGRIPIQISLQFVHRSPIRTKPALVQVVAWHRPGDKPLPMTKMTQFTDA